MIIKSFSSKKPLLAKTRLRWINSFQDTFAASPVYSLDRDPSKRKSEANDLYKKISSWKSLRGFYISGKGKIIGGIVAIDIAEIDPLHLIPIANNPAWKKLLRSYSKIAYLQIIFVQPQFQRKHYGQKLLKKLLHDLKQHGYQMVFTRTANAAAYENFYKKIPGFAPIVKNLIIPNKTLKRFYFAFKLSNS